MFLHRQEDARLADADAFEQKLQRQHGLARARPAADQRGPAGRESAEQDIVQSGHARSRFLNGRVEAQRLLRGDNGHDGCS